MAAMTLVWFAMMVLVGSVFCEVDKFDKMICTEIVELVKNETNEFKSLVKLAQKYKSKISEDDWESGKECVEEIIKSGKKILGIKKMDEGAINVCYNEFSEIVICGMRLGAIFKFYQAKLSAQNGGGYTTPQSLPSFVNFGSTQSPQNGGGYTTPQSLPSFVNLGSTQSSPTNSNLP